MGKRDEALRVFMTIEGRTSNLLHCSCCRTNSPGEAEYICEDCFSRRMVCASCCVRLHAEKPLDNIKVGIDLLAFSVDIHDLFQRWNGKFFEDASLHELGLRVQLGHPDGSCCLRPEPGPANFTVIHLNKIHCVNVDFCGCSVSLSKDRWEQLTLNEWLPATLDRPKTVCTFRVLELFHMLSHRGKTTAYDFYTTLEKLTDNIGGRQYTVRCSFAD